MNTEKKLWWLWIPLVMLLIQFAIEWTVPQKTYTALVSENGPHELMQFFILAGAFMVAAKTLLAPGVRKNKWLLAWVGLAAAGCLYVAGEEVSWGQHFLGWTTPENWQAVNDQKETNLHNTSSWLDQKPRLVLEIGVITGGLLLPFLKKFRPALVPGWLGAIAPPSRLCVTAGLFLFVKLADMAGDAGIRLFGRGSEVGELYLFYFVLLYLLDLRKKTAYGAVPPGTP